MSTTEIFAAPLPLLQTGTLDLFIGAGGGRELLRDEFGLEEIASDGGSKTKGKT
jgi:hypothetical protein